MTKGRKKGWAQFSEGFTIVELLIVIFVIGILAALVLNTILGVQARARDLERKTDIKAITKALESYYVLYSSYPSPETMTGDVNNIKILLGGLDTSALRSPGTVPNTNSVADGRDANFDPANAKTYYYYDSGVPSSPGDLANNITPGLNANVTCTTEAYNCTAYSIGWVNEVGNPAINIHFSSSFYALPDTAFPLP